MRAILYRDLACKFRYIYRYIIQIFNSSFANLNKSKIVSNCLWQYSIGTAL